jgi:acyl dehydratase
VEPGGEGREVTDRNIQVKIGDEIPSLTKTATMREWTGESSRIHEDSYAKKIGMRGAILGGSILYSYLVEMLFGYFGDNWFNHGEASVSFIGGGVIAGDKVIMKGVIKDKKPEDSGTRLSLDIWMENETNRKKAVVGTASCLVS